MIFGFMKNRFTASDTDPVAEIGRMIDHTWDLTLAHPVEDGHPESRALGVFNTLFEKLNRTVTAILRNVVALAALAPELKRFSKAFQHLAGEQATKVSDIAAAGDRITRGIEDISTSTADLNRDFSEIKGDVETAFDQGDQSMAGFKEIKTQVSILVDTIGVLRENSASIGSISDTINAISDETNILSLNARIEAARGQSDGKGFKVIAEEVGHLAKQSKAATNDIRERLELLGEKISQTVAAVETVEKNVSACERQILDANAALGHVRSQFSVFSEGLDRISTATEQQAEDVKWVAVNIGDIEDSAEKQTHEVDTILTIAERVNSACDGMVMDAGVFHLSGHGRAREAAMEMAGDADLVDGTREARERTLLAYMERFRFIELAYITDAGGKQVTANIYAKALAEKEGLTRGLGSDWSGKAWFTKALKNTEPFVSKVYRSSATKEFCFTVSLPLRGAGG